MERIGLQQHWMILVVTALISSHDKESNLIKDVNSLRASPRNHEGQSHYVTSSTLARYQAL